MEIEKIIYDTTRALLNVEDKLRIATIFIFCWRLSGKSFAELLYCKDHSAFINRLNQEYTAYEVNFTIRLEDKNIRSCFYLTLEKVKEKYDSEGYYKALFNGDEYALVIDQIVNYNFDKLEFKKSTQKLVGQLSLGI